MSDRPINSTAIMKTTAYYFDVSVEDLTGPRRYPHVTYARHIAMHLCRELVGLSYPQIGRLFGGRDHSTVMAAKWSLQEKASHDPKVNEHIADVEFLLVPEAVTA